MAAVEEVATNSTVMEAVEEVPESPEDPLVELRRIGQRLLVLKDEPIERVGRALWGLGDDWTGTEDTLDAVSERLQAKSSQALSRVGITYHKLQQRFGEDDEAWHGIQRETERYMRAFYYAQHALFAQAQMRRALMDIPDVESNEDADTDGADERANPPICVGLAHFAPPTDDPKATNGYQKLLLYLLQQAYYRQYRKRDETCFRRMKVPGGHDTHSWETCGHIRDFIYDVANKEYNFDMWGHLTKTRGSMECAVQYLANGRDPQFPKLVKDRRYYSFNNGIYQTCWNKCPDTGAWAGRFVAYTDTAFARKIPEHIVTCKFFDQEFVEHDDKADWYHIPTPAMQQVLDSQKYPEEVCRWMYVFIGRLMYEMNGMDRWQKIPFLEGQAATGKSTLLMHVAKRLYTREDVGVLSNNIEKKFGLSAFCDKYLFIAPEVREDLGLDQAEFQSMVSGEDMSVAKKFAVAEQVQWRVPGILAGNQVPKWRDSAGSIARRLVVFNFSHKPEVLDTTLGDKLRDEMPAIILKCNRAYLEAVHSVGKSNLDACLPEYFQQTNQDLIHEVNSLRHFLSSGQLKTGADCYMPMKDFTKMYNEHCRDNGFVPERMSKSNYGGPFMSYGVAVRKETREWPRDSGVFSNKDYVIGLEEDNPRQDQFWGLDPVVAG